MRLRSVVPHEVDGHRYGMRRQAARHRGQHRRLKLAGFGIVRIDQSAQCSRVITMGIRSWIWPTSLVAWVVIIAAVHSQACS